MPVRINQQVYDRTGELCQMVRIGENALLR
jgi:hypothetical protein